MVEQDLSVPVIAIDGGAGTGKGTARASIAQLLGFHSLDSGVLYRALGLVCVRKNIIDIRGMQRAACELDLRVDSSQRIFLDGEDETEIIRSEEAGKAAARISPIREVREALLDYQLTMRKLPGLVTDGRDQGIIFETSFRYFLTCDAEERARRRVLEYRAMNQTCDYALVLQSIRDRDAADENRKEKPLKPHPEAIMIDTTRLKPEQVVEIILDDFASR